MEQAEEQKVKAHLFFPPRIKHNGSSCLNTAGTSKEAVARASFLSLKHCLQKSYLRTVRAGKLLAVKLLTPVSQTQTTSADWVHPQPQLQLPHGTHTVPSSTPTSGHPVVPSNGGSKPQDLGNKKWQKVFNPQDSLFLNM